MTVRALRVAMRWIFCVPSPPPLMAFSFTGLLDFVGPNVVGLVSAWFPRELLKPGAALGPRETRSLLPAECSGLAGSPACLAARLAAVSSFCFASSLTLTPAVQGCFASPLLIERGTLPVSLSGAGISCTSAARQSLFEIDAGVSLELRDVTLTSAGSSQLASGSGAGAAALRVCSTQCGSSERASLILANVTMRGFSTTSAAESAISVYASSELLVLPGCLFDRNTCAGGSGGVCSLIGDDASASFDGSTFTRNTASGARGGGGALAVRGSRATLHVTACAFSQNAAHYGDGGAVYVGPSANEGARVVLSDVAISGCTAGVSGGAVASIGARGSLVSLVNVTIDDCTAGFGGSLSAASSAVSGASDMAVSSMHLMPAVAASGSTTGGSIVLSGSRTRLGASRATFGGGVFLCDSLVGIASDVPFLAGPYVADGAGGFAFSCNPANVSWLGLATGSLAAGSIGGSAAGLYGPVRASPPLTISLSGDVPTVLSSGVALGAGTARLMDSFGQQVYTSGAGGIVVQARLSARSSAVLVTADGGGVVLLGARASDGAYDLSALAVALIDWPGSVGSAVDVDFSLFGADGLAWPTARATSAPMTLLGCSSGFGRLSQDSAIVPLVCGRCAGVSSSSSSSSGTPAPPPPPFGSTDACPVFRCDANSVASSSGGASANESSTTTMTTVCVCKAGFYGEPCVACPPGGLCAGGSAGPVAAPGFFPDSSGGVFVACPRAQSCLGGGVCARGYSGRLCGSCAAGYYSLRNRCLACARYQAALVGAALCVLTLATGCALIWFNLSTYAHRFVAAMIGLQALQISAMFGRLELDFGAIANAYFSVASLLNVNFQLTSPECSLARSIDAWTFKWILTLLLPLWVALALGVCFCLYAVARRTGRLARLAALNVAQLADATKRSWYQAMVLLYLPLTGSAFVLFGCQRDEAGRWIMSDLPSRLCYDARWYRLLAPACLAVIGYALAGPAALYVVVWRARRTAVSDGLAVFLLRYGFLVGRFRDGMWAFESANMGMKLGVVIAMTFLQTTSGRAAGALLVLAVASTFVLAVRPYRTALHNQLAFGTLATTTAVLFGGIIADYGMRRTVVLGGLFGTIVALVAGNAADLRLLWLGDRAASKTWARSGNLGRADESFAADDLHGAAQHSFGNQRGRPGVRLDVLSVDAASSEPRLAESGTWTSNVDEWNNPELDELDMYMKPKKHDAASGAASSEPASSGRTSVGTFVP